MTRYTDPTRFSLERKIRGLVALGSGIDSSRVIPGNTNNPIPVDESGVPFVFVTLIADRRVGIPYYRHIDHGNVTYEFMYELRNADYSITWIADDFEGTDYPVEFESWMATTPGIIEQQKNDLVFSARSEVRSEDKMFTQQRHYERRRSMDVEIAYKRVVRHDVGWYDAVDINIHHDRAQGLSKDPLPDEVITVRVRS